MELTPSHRLYCVKESHRSRGLPFPSSTGFVRWKKKGSLVSPFSVVVGTPPHYLLVDAPTPYTPQYEGKGRRCVCYLLDSEETRGLINHWESNKESRAKVVVAFWNWGRKPWDERPGMDNRKVEVDCRDTRLEVEWSRRNRRKSWLPTYRWISSVRGVGLDVGVDETVYGRVPLRNRWKRWEDELNCSWKSLSVSDYR